MHLLKMFLRCINAVGCVKKRHAPRCIHKMQAILSVLSPPLTIGGTVLKESDGLVILGVTFDSKMTFEKHLRCFQSSFSMTWYLEEVLGSIP